MNEVENTMRTLADDEPLVTRWQCYVNLHRWEHWGDPYIPKGGDANIQHRFCVGCNKMQVRKIARFL